MLELNPNHMELIKKILAIYAKDQTVWAYGSRVKGTAHAGSDLDLVIVNNDDTFNSESLSALKAAFSESNLPISVDVLSWHDLPEYFNKIEIAKRHEVIQEA